MTIRPARLDDVEPLARLRHALWPEGTVDEHRSEARRLLSGELPGGPWTAFVASTPELVGFAEASVRPFAEGCRSEPVAYLEGWYVAPAVRRTGIGLELVAAVESWGRMQGCRELASDSDPANAVSLAAHLGAGFDDVGLVRCYRKRL